MKEKWEINNSFTSMDRLSRNKIIKEILTINDTLELSYIYRTFHAKCV